MHLRATGHHAAAIMVGIAATVTVVGAGMPWLHSGARSRSSFELLAIARRLGLSPEGWQGAALRLWPLVPLVCVLATIAAWWGRPALAAALAGGAAVVSSWLALSVRGADMVGNLRLAAGPLVTLIGSFLLLAAAGIGVAIASGPDRAR